MEDSYLLALSLIPGVTNRTLEKLNENFSSWKAFEKATAKQLTETGISEDLGNKLLYQRKKIDTKRLMDYLKKQEIGFITPNSADYPEYLRQISHKPMVLYYKGDIKVLSKPAVAVVGTRKASPYGLDTAYQFGKKLAEMGFTVVSGMARGIDGEAQRGALTAGGKVIAVLGGGVDNIYPPEHKKLYHDILEKGGVIVSEYPPGSKPYPKNFPERNRIVAGLALGVTVIEAPEKSGALITARMAFDDNREVFAVPGNIDKPSFAGSNLLIQRSGAKLVTKPEDIVEEFDWVYPQKEESKAEPDTLSGWTEPVGLEKEILDYLTGKEGVHFAEIVEEFGSETIEVLTDLEIDERIRRLPGGYYRKF